MTDRPSLYWQAFTRAHLGAEAGHTWQRLDAGLSNYNWVLDNRYVLRINRNCDSLGSGRGSEVAAWRCAAAAGLAPELIAVADANRAYLSRFLAQPQPDWPAHWAGERSAQQIRQLLAQTGAGQQPIGDMEPLLVLLNGIAALPEPDYKVSLAEQWRTYQRALEPLAKDPSLAAHYQLLRHLEPKVSRWLDELAAITASMQFCHRDLNPYNLLWRGDQLQCIDFEYACASHPLLDLATVLATHSFNAGQLQWLVSHYLNAHPYMGMNAVTALPAAINLYWLFACCWALLQGPERLPEYQQYYALLAAN